MTEGKKYKLRVPKLSEVEIIYGAVYSVSKRNVVSAITDLTCAFLSCFPTPPSKKQLADIFEHVAQNVTPSLSVEIKNKVRKND